jgi:hypothetical protein
MSEKRDRRPSAALIVSMLALVVALGGTAYAAVQLPKNSVGAAQIKKNAVRSAEVKNKSLKAKDLKPGELGTVVVAPAGNTPVTITAVGGGNPGNTPVRAVSLPQGTYQVTATVYVINDSNALEAEPRCSLRTTGSFLAEGLTGFYLQLPPFAGTNPSRAQFQLEGTVRVGSGGGSASVECNKDSAGQNFRVGASLTAMQVLSATVSP